MFLYFVSYQQHFCIDNISPGIVNNNIDASYIIFIKIVILSISLFSVIIFSSYTKTLSFWSSLFPNKLLEMLLHWHTFIQDVQKVEKTLQYVETYTYVFSS